MANGANTGFEVRDSSIGGKGLFAIRPFSRGEFIVEYTGKHIPTSYADMLKTNRYLFEVDRQWTIDGSGEENIARYANHSCEPNAEADIQDGRILYYAAKNISAGDEITIDYGDEYYDEFIKPVGCKCGAKRHRS